MEKGIHRLRYERIRILALRVASRIGRSIDFEWVAAGWATIGSSGDGGKASQAAR